MAIDDEQTPLLADQLNDEATVHQSPSKDTDPNLVDFDPEHDPDNPLDFSRSYKWIVTALLALMAFNTTFTCVGVVPVADRIIRDLSSDHKPNKSASVLLVTIWELGEAAGPLLIGPLSELYGRRLIINVANTGFVAATILAALCQDPTLFIAARVLTGLAVASNVLNPAIVGDIFISEHRGSAMSLIMLAPMVGGAVGPAIAGGLAETLGWRAILWLSVILMSICCVSFILVFRETYKVVILRRRAAHLRLTTNNPNLHTPYDALRTSLGASILRPFTVFFSSPVLIAVSLYASTTFTVFYIMSTTLPNILTDVYHLTPAQTGSAFIVFSVGSTLGVILCNLTLDRIYIYLRDRGLPKPTTGDPPRVGKPEHRLPLTLLGALLLPLSLFLYAYLPTTSPRPTPLPYLLLNLFFMGFTLLLSFLPVLSYIVDATGIYSASAMTAVIVVRCLFGTFGPLLVAPVVGRWGWRWGMGGLAAGVLVMATIVVVILLKGEKWRKGSVYMSGS